MPELPPSALPVLIAVLLFSFAPWEVGAQQLPQSVLGVLVPACMQPGLAYSCSNCTLR
jgi:hypothetical protein